MTPTPTTTASAPLHEFIQRPAIATARPTANPNLSTAGVCMPNFTLHRLAVNRPVRSHRLWRVGDYTTRSELFEERSRLVIADSSPGASDWCRVYRRERIQSRTRVTVPRRSISRAASESLVDRSRSVSVNLEPAVGIVARRGRAATEVIEVCQEARLAMLPERPAIREVQRHTVERRGPAEESHCQLVGW